MYHKNCDIIIRTENGECLTYTANCVYMDIENDYEDVQNCDSLTTSQILVSTRHILRAEVCPKPSEPYLPQEKGLLKRLISKIV